MGDKKILIAGIIVIILVMTTTLGMGLFFYFKYIKVSPPATINQNNNLNAGVDGYLPTSPGLLTDANGLNDGIKADIEKDKYFISSFFQAPEIKYTAQVPQYQLPINQIKEAVTNYRNLSRKINIEPVLDNLSQNGFAIIDDPFGLKTADWQSSYKTIRENELPIFITADSVLGLYQNTLQIIYKEIEEENFYPSLWSVLKEMFDKVEKRYILRRSQFGIETDIVTEANRVELAYLAVALKLLEPTKEQVKETITPDKKFFSPIEAEKYSIKIPNEITNDVNKELESIKKRVKAAKSNIFLYQKDYSKYIIPEHYQSSEKLKNYYLAITWLNDALFPLWGQENDCPQCLLDQQDHTLIFLAGLYLSDDLSADQKLKNQWANIYKSISFFKGLEADITYLHYKQALEETFGAEYSLNEIFSDTPEKVREKIGKLQEKIAAYPFLASLRDSQKEKKNVGLRLLRNRYLLEQKVFDTLLGESTGKFIPLEENPKFIPATACRQQDGTYLRCQAIALDLFNILDNKTARTILAENGDTRYENYQQNLNYLVDQLKEFNEYTWHDNAYLSLLSSLQYLNYKNSANFPSFMQNPAWAKKSLNTSLGSWVDFHREITLQKIVPEDVSGFRSQFSYGYVEPVPEFYSQIAANAKMAMDGLTNLKIISPTSISYKRLQDLKTIVGKINEISLKELKNEELTGEDYNFINDFNQKIKMVTGDIKKENLQNINSFTYQFPQNKKITESLTGHKYIIVIYPDKEGKLFFAVGPIFNYSEGINVNPTKSPWQKELGL